MSNLFPWFGCGGILLAALFLSHTLSAFARARLAQTEAYLAFLRHIRGQIACYNRPFGEIAGRMDAGLLSSCGIHAVGSSPAEMLGAADLLLCAEAVYVLREFADAFGQGYRDEQLALCDAAERELDAIALRLRQRLPEQLRLIRCCVFCGALALILVLI